MGDNDKPVFNPAFPAMLKGPIAGVRKTEMLPELTMQEVPLGKSQLKRRTTVNSQTDAKTGDKKDIGIVTDPQQGGSTMTTTTHHTPLEKHMQHMEDPEKIAFLVDELAKSNQALGQKVVNDGTSVLGPAMSKMGIGKKTERAMLDDSTTERFIAGVASNANLPRIVKTKAYLKQMISVKAAEDYNDRSALELAGKAAAIVGGGGLALIGIYVVAEVAYGFFHTAIMPPVAPAPMV